MRITGEQQFDSLLQPNSAPQPIQQALNSAGRTGLNFSSAQVLEIRRSKLAKIESDSASVCTNPRPCFWQRSLGYLISSCDSKDMAQDSKSGFSVSSTAEEVTKGVDASGLTAIVTGATAGIGKETARVLALRGAHVYLTGRTVKSATETKEAILNEVSDAKLDILAPLDLSSQASVRKCAETFLALDRPLNLLINNAGVMLVPPGLTVDGIEIHFGTNHIGHFLLTNLLLDKLKETANQTGIESRIVNVSSAGIRFSPKEGIAWDKISKDMGEKGFMTYGISKIANVYHAQELTRRLQEEGVTNVSVNSLHPGKINTNLGRHSKWMIGLLYAISFWSWKSISQGAATQCYAALHPSVKGVSGKFFVDSNEFDPKVYNPLAEDEQEAKKLWDLSVQLTST